MNKPYTTARELAMKSADTVVVALKADVQKYMQAFTYANDHNTRLQEENERLRAELTAEHEQLNKAKVIAMRLQSALDAERERSAKLADDNINRSNAIVRLESELATERGHREDAETLIREYAAMETPEFLTALAAERDAAFAALEEARDCLKRSVDTEWSRKVLAAAIRAMRKDKP